MRTRQPTNFSPVLVIITKAAVSSLLLISSPLLSSVAFAQTFSSTTTTTRPACTSHNGCFDCVNAGCAWGIGTCFDSCDELPEMSCYSIQQDSGTTGFTPTTTTSTTTSNSNTATEICSRQQDDAYDVANCGIQTTCEKCTSTPLKAVAVEERQEDMWSTVPPPTPTCSWYEDRKKCSHLQCDSMGCSSPYCPSSPEGQCYFGADNCLDCLNNVESQSCSWSGGSCQLNCLPDVTCYSPLNFVNLNNEGICQTASNFEADTKLCLGQTNCGSCTQTRKTDGTNCQWYYDVASQTGWCGMGGCNENNLCGLTSCVGVPGSTAINYPVCDGLESLDPEDLTCEACVGSPNGCGWTTAGQCLGSCSAVADIPCYEYEVGTTGQSIQSICNDAAIAIADATLCGSKTTAGCSECVQTLKSDRRTRCQWYSVDDAAPFGTTGTSVSYCGVGGCDGLGNCGNPTCEGVVDATNTGSGAGNCNAATNCNTCLNNPPCVWGGDQCYESCNDVTFPKTCYSPNEAEFIMQATSTICAQAPAPVPAPVSPAQTPTSSAGGVGVIVNARRNVVVGITTLFVTLAMSTLL